MSNHAGFINDMNERLGPILEIKQDTSRPHPVFGLHLRDTGYVMTDQVVLNYGDEFAELVQEIGKSYFDAAPGFNNTGRVFWFIL
jgi:hypothetical protein